VPVVTHPEVVGSDQEDGIRLIEERFDPRRVAGLGRRGIGAAVTPRRRVQHEARRRRERTDEGIDGRTARARRSASLPVRSTSVRGSPVTGTRAVSRPNADSSRPRTSSEAAREDADARLSAGRARAAGGLLAPRERHRTRGRDLGIQSDALERDAVPELHDDAARRAVAVDIAEAVRHDDDGGARRECEPAPRRLRGGRDAALARERRFGIRSREPDCAFPLGAASRHSAQAPSASPTAEPKTHRSAERGTSAVTTRPDVQRDAQELPGVAGADEKDAIPRAYRGVASFFGCRRTGVICAAAGYCVRVPA
jgi:hypothetical protein